MTPPERRDARPDRPPRPELCREIAVRLAAGELVALPTETVYGIAARADREVALERLGALKGTSERGFTWHVPSRGALEAFDELRGVVGRLAGRYWPGPLTLVLHGVPPGLDAVAVDGWTGLRMPAHAATRAILEAVDGPVVMTSANRAGGTPANDPDEIARTFAGEVALVVDGGPPEVGEGSTVLRVGGGRFELLREGIVALPDLRRTAGLSLGFVCTGNTCRSPMAAALAERRLAERLGVFGESSGAGRGIGRFGFRVVSAGIHAGVGSRASEHSLAALLRFEVDLGGHRSRPAVPEEIAALDRVYGMTAAHVEALTLQLPPGRAGHVQLLDPSGADVPDPIGGSLEEYERCAERIRAAIDARLDEWV